MDLLYSIVSFVGITAVSIGIAEALCRFAPKFANPRVDENHSESLHGLRGFLAICVLGNTGWTWYGFSHNSLWAAPSELLGNVGRIAAILFFAVSGFLYWEKLRANDFEFRQFYRSRLRRLAPAYFALLSVLLVIVLVRSGFRPRAQFATLLSQLVPWLTFGISAEPATVNGVTDLKIVTGGVLWALTTQCYFYLTLPFLGYFTRGNRPLLLIAAAAAIVSLPAMFFVSTAGRFFQEIADLYWPTQGFALGILASYLHKIPQVHKAARNPIANLVAVACFIGAIATCRMETFGHTGVIPALCALGFLLVVTGGDTLWNTLSHRSLAWLGNISYAMYLFHGVTLYLLAQLANGVMPFKSQSWGQSFVVLAIFSAVCIAIAGAVNRYVEQRFAARQRRNNNDGGKVVNFRRAA